LIFCWKHFPGDGWEFGFYDGANLARKRNVIIVAPNYRVGPFGFMSLPELQQEDGSNGSTGNYGLQVIVCDQ
jgi:para-nitrobenzyl esterase